MQHLPVHPTLLHPLTHEPLRALGRFRGRWIWPVLGGDDSVDPVPAGDTPPAADPKPDEPTPPKPDAPKLDGDFDPQRAMALIEKLRAESAENKKAAKEAATAAQQAAIKAAQDAQAEQARKLGLALGLIDEDEAKDKQTDADALLRDIQKQLADQATANNALRQEIALRDAAAQHGADLVELLDRRSFLDSLSGLDPNAQGYAARVAKAVAEAVEKNPRLRLEKGEPEKKPAAGKSGAEITGQPPRTRERPKSLYEAVSRQMSGSA